MSDKVTQPSTIEPITEYLKNPIAAGVYNLVVLVDISGVTDYLNGLLKQYKESDEEVHAKRRIPSFMHERVSRQLKAQLEELKETDSEEYFPKLTSALTDFAEYCECPKEMKETLAPTRRIRIGGRERIVRGHRRVVVFDSHPLPGVADVLYIARQEGEEGKWLFDVTSIRENGVARFKAVIGSIPPIGEKLKVLREAKRHSSRYSFRPYPLACKLWLDSEASASVPSDLKSFLLGAIDYINDEEWRTSIILSAITVESELADIYEECHKSSAPDVPLGDLFQRVKSKVKIPEDIALAVDTTNRARISAVHRSRLPVSQREAVIALYGAFNFTRWHLFDNP